MKKQITIFALLLLASALKASESHPKIDSLKQLLPTTKDTLLAKLHFDISSYYRVYNLSIDSTEFYLKKAITLAEKYNYQRGKEEKYYYLGMLESSRDNNVEAINYYKQYESIAATKKKIGRWVISKSALAVQYRRLGDLETALQYLLEAAQIAEEHQETDDYSHIYINIGVIYDTKKEYEKAIPYYREALKYVKEKKSQYFSIENTAYYNIAADFLDLDQLDSAKVYLDKGVLAAKAAKFFSGEVRLLAVLSELNLKQYRYETVLSLTEDLLKKLEKINYASFQFLKIEAYSRRAMAFYYLGNIKQALQANDTAIKLSQDCNDIFCKKGVLKTSAFLYEQIGDFKQALIYSKQHYSIQDSILNQEKELNLQNLQALYENEKKERQIVTLNQEKQAQSFQLKRRNFIIGVIITFALLAFFLLYLISQRRVLKNQQIASESEQKLLRLQMNPHFLFNALSSIQTYLFNREDTQKAIVYLSRFAELMRQILEYSRETYITIEDEIRTLENYLSLQQLRHNHEFDYEIEVDTSINRWETFIPPLMAQPFVENAIEHGKLHTFDNGKVKVSFKKSNQQILLTVEDNGIGRAKAMQLKTQKKYKSLATSITRERMELLRVLTKKQFGLETNDLPETGTKVQLRFPLHLN